MQEHLKRLYILLKNTLPRMESVTRQMSLFTMEWVKSLQLTSMPSPLLKFAKIATLMYVFCQDDL